MSKSEEIPLESIASSKKTHYQEELNEITNTKEKRLIDCFEKPEIYITPPTSMKRRENSQLTSPLSPKTIARSIPSGPCRILDAPELMDDYYLNLLSWGHHNIIAVALRQSVYLWYANDGRIVKLLTLSDHDQYVTSVQWAPTDNLLAVGLSNNCIQLWDTSAITLIRNLTGHTNRVSSLSWNSNHYLSSGSRDSTILNHDIRQPMNVISTFQGHSQEVCGLAWSSDGMTLASGGNENLLLIWDVAYAGIHHNNNNMNHHRTSSSSNGDHSRDGPRLSIDQHTAAVKVQVYTDFDVLKPYNSWHMNVDVLMNSIY